MSPSSVTDIQQETLVRLIIDPKFRDEIRKDSTKLADTFGCEKASFEFLNRVNFDQLERFNQITLGTRLTSLKQKYAPIEKTVGSDLLEVELKTFLREHVIYDGRGDLDVLLFEKFCKTKYPKTVFASLISAQTARFIAGFGCRNYSNLPVKLGFRVKPIETALPLDDLNEVSINDVFCEHAKHSFYVFMPDGDKTAVHEIDEDSFQLLEMIADHARKFEVAALTILLEKNYDVLVAASEEGIVELWTSA